MQLEAKTSIENYSHVALNYIKGRPPYPKEAIRLLQNALGIRSGKMVVDLASGTGKLTECLLDTYAQIIAIEPKEEMRHAYGILFPHIKLLEGKAESIPLLENSMDSILVGTAFHWFEGTKALSEIARVLKSKGGLGLIWNVLDDNIDWVKKMYETKDKYCQNKAQVHQNHVQWKESFENCPLLFSPLQHRTIFFSYLGKAQRVIERMLSSRIITNLPKEKQDIFVQEICEKLSISISDVNSKELLIPYRTEIYWTYKL
jgi:SAM-dependent methyltransferase